MSEMSNISSDRNLLPPKSDLEANQTTPVEVVSSSELTTEEWSDRIFLERQVERAFYIAAKALKELRDRRLYRSTGATFEDYCCSRFGFTRRHVNYLIAGSLVVDNLMGTQMKREPLVPKLKTQMKRESMVSKLRTQMKREPMVPKSYQRANAKLDLWFPWKQNNNVKLGNRQ